jgi:ubiquinone/menaquinone biosynthesis C-methylase UbiE
MNRPAAAPALFYARCMGLRQTLFAATYDRMSRSAEEAGLGALRERLLADAAGRVLEIGAGTGANLSHYGDDVESLVLTEPASPMVRRLRQTARAKAPLAQVVQASAEDLPFDDDAFDTVVSTLVLCGVGDQARALREVRRVLRPGGRLLFLEHVRSDDPGLARLQDRMNWLNRLVVRCECNRQTLAAIHAEGFGVPHVERTAMPKAPRLVRPLIVGTAVS